MSRPNKAFIVAGGDYNVGARWRCAMGMEMAMTLRERAEAIERIEVAAYARGHACPFAVAVRGVIPIIKS